MTSKLLSIDELIEHKLPGANLDDYEDVIPYSFKDAMDAIEELRAFSFCQKNSEKTVKELNSIHNAELDTHRQSAHHTMIEESGSSRRNSGIVTDESQTDFTQSWIEKHTTIHRPEQNISRQIYDLKGKIHKLQSKVRDTSRSLKKSYAMPRQCVPRGVIENEEKRYEQALAELAQAEKALMELESRPDPRSSTHYEQTTNTEMEEAGQYANYPLPKSPTPPCILTNSNAFQKVSPKKAARPQLEKSNPPIDTSNRFQNLMDTTENNISTDPEIKISIPDINLKLSNDYNLTIQEIVRNFPETTCKYNRGYIRISPHSLEDRDKIIETLDKTEKEYVLSESPENRPIKIVIKNLPPDHSKDSIVNDLVENKYHVIRINQLRNYRLKTFLPIFLVELAKTPNSNNIFQLEKINNFNVKIEHYRKKPRATMCYKCSDFFHSARNCKCKPRCIKCNGSHETRMCSIKTKIENPVCINCKENGHLDLGKDAPNTQ
ncbi:hypothetical protein AVEN_253290-1 [Araneus ventricosus]|uniref:Pre-C2HC domain-containing protein n=1 Tax=Araneus ventricosus TaxID=182803 RepID=A0A4Y2KQ62_ARAVE|nr:hypothetical protein AVEN_253290-1 [Araneus ventricosus]